MLFVFWISLLLVGFTYVLYPALVRLISIRKKPNPLTYGRGEEPTVSVLISAYNEEKVIGEKILSVIGSDYPAGKLEILVGSDASGDRTVEIVRQLARQYSNIRCLHFSQRRGKPSVINDLAGEARGEILVFTDANVMFHPQTIFELAKHFKNPTIGLVDSRMINTGTKPDGISYQEKAYITREVSIKHYESLAWGAMMGPFGGCYAVRRDEFIPVPPESLVDDFFICMRILESGKKAINELKAMVFEDVSNNLWLEYRRKVRIATGNFQNLARFAHLLLTPWKPISFAFLSHKVIRWLGPVLLLLLLLASAVLATSDSYFVYISIFQLFLMCVVPVLDRLGAAIHLHISLLRLITHFYAMNLALLMGMINFMKGNLTGVWTPTKRNQ